jgi:hypothetical protein
MMTDLENVESEMDTTCDPPPALEQDEPQEARPQYILDHEAHLEALKAEIGLAAIEHARCAADAKGAKRDLDELIETYAREKVCGPTPLPAPDPQQTLPLGFDPFECSVDELGLTDALTTALHDADLDSIGKVQAKMQAQPSDWFAGIKSLGRAKATIVESAVGTWLENNEPMEGKADEQPPYPCNGEEIPAAPLSGTISSTTHPELAEAIAAGMREKGHDIAAVSDIPKRIRRPKGASKK